MKRDPRAGAVLVVTLLVMLALELLAHGTLLLAREQAAASLADIRILRARAGARAALTPLPPDPGEGVLDTLAPGAVWEGSGPRLGEVAARWRLRRLTREAWLAEGWARVGATTWEAREARLLWRLEPGARVAAFAAVVEVGDVRRTRTSGPIVAPSSREECPYAMALLDSLQRREIGALAPASERRRAQGGLGPISWEEAAAAIPVHVTGRGTPSPSGARGICAEGPWNWGGSEGPDSPCAGERLWRAAPGDLLAEGGVGEGLLLALGNVELAGTSFRGVILARGDVRLTRGAELRGLALVGGALEVDSASRVVGSACAALEAFRGRPATLAGLRGVPGLGWLPVR